MGDGMKAKPRPTREQTEEQIKRWKSMPVVVVGRPSEAGVAAVRRAYWAFLEECIEQGIDPNEENEEAECLPC